MNSPFSIISYRKLFAAQLLSLAGTGISTIALALLAFDLAGDDAGWVLGTALALKMVVYVVGAPIIGSYMSRLPLKPWLVAMDLLRAGLILLLPWVSEIWQVYLLIVLINLCAAAFTPVYQSLLPLVVRERSLYLKALSYSRLAYDLEQLISPMVAGFLLTWMSFRGLFALDAATFAVSALLLLWAMLPNSRPSNGDKAQQARRWSYGIRQYWQTPELRALWGGYLAVASASAMAIVNTVVYVNQYLASDDIERATATAMAAMGLGSMLVALQLPKWLNRVNCRTVQFAGTLIITAALIGGLMPPSLTQLLTLWLLFGIGASLIQTSAGAVINDNSDDADRPALFAAHFSLSHLCWFVTYLLAGWLGANWSLDAAFSALASVSLVGLLLVALPAEAQSKLA